MAYLKQFIRLWKKPFPEDENPLIYYRTLLLVSLFVAFFLYVFQPFGIHLLEKNKLLICIGFGSMTFLGAMLYEFLSGKTPFDYYRESTKGLEGFRTLVREKDPPRRRPHG